MKRPQDVERYDIGCDMGTGSFGWSVSDENGDLLSFKHRPMWGVRLFDTGETAENRRMFRSTRRRLARRIQRLQWLKELVGQEVEKTDPEFFEKMKYSSLSPHDTQWDSLRSLFGNGHCNEMYCKQYPTIFHLRKDLAESSEKKDFRLVYLAMHHIIKYRGNFLYDGEIGIHGGLDLSGSASSFLSGFLKDDDAVPDLADSLVRILTRQGTSSYDKEKEISNVFYAVFPDKDDKKFCLELSKAIVGRKADFSVLFGSQGSFSLDDESTAEQYAASLDDDALNSFQALQKFYSETLLSKMLSGHVTTISDIYIHRYDEHRKDLLALKKVLRTCCTQEIYKNVFVGKNSLYQQYREHNSKDSSHDKFLGELRKILKDACDPAVEQERTYCLVRIEEGSFLKKPKSTDNGVIPNQLHCEELKAIIDHQKQYYPILAQEEGNILKIASFRIPYYVGPLSPRATEFGWAVRKEKGAVTPWNFEDKIDVMASAEKFITNRTDTCQYMYGEAVLPKNSLLYSNYCVLNELNGIRLDGKRLGCDVKRRLLAEVFSKQKMVSKGTVSKWLFKEGYADRDKGLDITGFQKEDGFASSLSSLIDFTRIFGHVDEKNEAMIENLILWNSLFSDKKILAKKIHKEYPDLGQDIVTAVVRLDYQGWGRLSRKLLTEVTTVNGEGRLMSIMDLLRETQETFMEILFDDAYGFQDAIEKENRKKQPIVSLDDYESVFPDVPISPSVKKASWQGLRVIREIVQVMGREPSHIYIEFTRDDAEKKRTVSRYYALEKLYKRLINDDAFSAVYQELISQKEAYTKKGGPLSDMRLFLYFCQNGKCLYSGTSLDINRLGDYQIDHILPQSYIKDNSIDNLALVLSGENQRKRDSLLLDDTIIKKQKPFWQVLRKNGLISSKKYRALTREAVSEEDFNTFINRQIVETSQAVKILSDVLQAVFPETTRVVGVKAGLSHGFRVQNGITKVREVNDYHHAHDAYLACQVGRFLTGQFGQAVRRKELYEEFQNTTTNARNQKNGFVVYCMSTEYGNWHGTEVVGKIRNAFGFHHYFLSRKTEELTGAFYNQTLLPKGENGGATVPSKEDRDPIIYGGYSGETLAYYDIIEFSKGKKRMMKLVGIPVRIVALGKTRPGAIDQYLASLYSQPIVRKKGICKYQYIRYCEKDGTYNEYYLVSDSEVINARELMLPLDTMKNLAGFNHLDDIGKQQVYLTLCEKMEKYPCYKSIADCLKRHIGDFVDLPSEKQQSCIQGMLTYMQANASRFDFAKQIGGDWKDIRSNRFSKKGLIPERIEFIDRSVTGMFERSYRIGIPDGRDH